MTTDKLKHRMLRCHSYLFCANGGINFHEWSRIISYYDFLNILKYPCVCEDAISYLNFGNRNPATICTNPILRSETEVVAVVHFAFVFFAEHIHDVSVNSGKLACHRLEQEPRERARLRPDASDS